MKKLYFFLFAVFSFFIANEVGASGFSQVISLDPGWNLISTPRVLSSHQFSVPATSENYSIYVLNPASASKWSTMSELGQTEFQPLYGYFIYNKTSTTTSLTLNYKQNVSPNERFFSRNLSAGWNVIGIANPSYALVQKDFNSSDTNNIKNILNSVQSSIQSVYDLTADQSNKFSVKVGDVWSGYNYNDADGLNDFRETKAYVTYNNSDGIYNGYQNNDEVEIGNENISSTTLGIWAYSSSTIAVKVGDSGVDLGDFNLSSMSPAKDIKINTITLKNNGVEDISKVAYNLYLSVDGAKVSTATSVNGRYITFTLNNGAYYLLKDNGSKTFSIKGDIISKESSDGNSLNFSLVDSSGISAFIKDTNFIVNTVSASSSNAIDNYIISSVAISHGGINISKKSTSPSDSNVVKGNNGIVALIANIHADEAITADGLNINYGSTMNGVASTTDQFQNAKIYLNGYLVDSFDPATSTNAFKTAILDSSINLNAGDNEVKIIVDSKSDVANNSAIKFWLGGNVLDSQNAEYVQSGNKVNTSEIGGSAEGAVLTVGKASLTMATSDGYANNKSIVKGSTDVSLGKFTVKATNDAVTITSAQLTGTTTATTTTSANSIYDMKLYVDGAQVGNTVDYSGSGANFSSLNITIAKDTTKTFEVFGSFDSASVEGSQFKAALALYAQDSKGKSVDNVSAATTQFAIAGQGSLNVSLGGSTPSAALLSANSSEQEVAEFKFTANNDSASLTELIVANATGTTAGTNGYSDADSRISAVKLYDGTTLIDSFTPVLGGGKFTITNDKVTVAANLVKNLSIKVVLNSIDNDASATNKAIAYKVYSYKFKSSNGTETSVTNQNPQANTFIIRKTVPTVAFLALPDTTLNAGDKDIAKFSVSADSAGDVTVYGVSLDVATTSGVTVSTTTNPVKINGILKTASSTTFANGKYTVVFATPEVIFAGTSKTFEIQANTSVTGNNSDSITAVLNEDSSFLTDANALTGNFVWSDGADNVNYTWANGYRVSGLTTNTWVMSK